MTTIPICFFFNHRIVIPAGVCITSLLKSARPDTFYDIYVFHPGDLNSDHKSTLTQLKNIYPNCKFNFIDVSDRFHHAHILRGIPNVTYYRLLVPDFLLHYDKAIISDVDIIFNSDLTELYNLDLEGYYIAGVKNASCHRRYVKKIGCDPNKYVNCGFLVYNLQEMRAHKIQNSFYKLVGKKYIYLDQDIINIVCKNKVKFLPPKYNLTGGFYRIYYQDKERLKLFFSEEEIEEGIKAFVSLAKNESQNSYPCIIHYNGVNPWESLTWRHDIWWEYYRKSIYFDHYFYYKYNEIIVYGAFVDLFKKIIKYIMRKYFKRLKDKILPT